MFVNNKEHLFIKIPNDRTQQPVLGLWLAKAPKFALLEQH